MIFVQNDNALGIIMWNEAATLVKDFFENQFWSKSCRFIPPVNYP
jgi:hypothetical protein